MKSHKYLYIMRFTKGVLQKKQRIYLLIQPTIDHLTYLVIKLDK